MTNKIVSRLKVERTRSGLSQRALAEAVGVSRQTIHNIESGRAEPSVTLALRIANQLGATVETLFGAQHTQRAQWVDLGNSSSTGPRRLAVGEVDGRLIAHALSASDSAAWVTSSNAVAAKPRSATVEVTPSRRSEAMFLSGCDPALGVLAGLMGSSAVWLPTNSTRSLAAFAGGQVHVAGLHLLDAQTSTYNVPLVKSTGRAATVVRLASWSLGLVVAAGNPLKLRRAADVVRTHCRMAMRDAGSGAQGLLERLVSVSAFNAVPGVATSHHDVARLVAAGAADAGVSVASAAQAFGLGFVPLSEEHFDLAMRGEDARLMNVLSGSAFRRQVATLGGYSTRESGRVVARV